MKLFFKKFLPITALTLIGVVNAQVVQKETPDALIIVSRPVDMWSPDFKFNQRRIQARSATRLSD